MWLAKMIAGKVDLAILEDAHTQMSMDGQAYWDN